jgi:hypothetical protein
MSGAYCDACGYNMLNGDCTCPERAGIKVAVLGRRVSDLEDRDKPITRAELGGLFNSMGNSLQYRSERAALHEQWKLKELLETLACVAKDTAAELLAENEVQ